MTETQQTLFADVVLDFDGVLHSYHDGWRDGELYGKPIEGSVEAVWQLYGRCLKLIVSTARANTLQQRLAVETWLAKYGYPFMLVTNLKPVAWIYLDDRGIRFLNWAQALRDMDRVLDRVQQ